MRQLRLYYGVLLVVGVLASCNHAQDILEELSIMMRTMIDNQRELISKFEEMETNMESKMEELETNMESKMEEVTAEVNGFKDSIGILLNTTEEVKAEVNDFKDSIEILMNTTGDLRVVHQQCSRGEQVDTFQTIFTTGKQEIISSCQREISDFRDLLATDECEEGRHNCSDLAVCTDESIHYKCSCISGYTGDGFICQDIDECRDGNITCGLNEICLNNQGSYMCICKEGYKKEGNNCQDIDECDDGNTTCGVNEICSNNQGSYMCICPAGYKKKGDKCQDIDECASGSHDCHPDAVCTNTPGSFNCQCRQHAFGDGRNCDKVCDSESHIIEGIGCVYLVSSDGVAKGKVSLDSRMTWEVAGSMCKSLGLNILENIKHEHLVTLSQRFLPLMPDGYRNVWVGVKHSKWISSGMTVDSHLWKEAEPDGGDHECGYLRMLPSQLGLGDYVCSDPHPVLCYRMQ